MHSVRACSGYDFLIFARDLFHKCVSSSLVHLTTHSPLSIFYWEWLSDLPIKGVPTDFPFPFKPFPSPKHHEGNVIDSLHTDAQAPNHAILGCSRGQEKARVYIMM